MEFEFDKFVTDIKQREAKQLAEKKVSQEVVEQDRLRRLRAEQYHERWQNRIKWER